jgi:hypothetical protein
MHLIRTLGTSSSNPPLQPPLLFWGICLYSLHRNLEVPVQFYVFAGRITRLRKSARSLKIYQSTSQPREGWVMSRRSCFPRRPIRDTDNVCKKVIRKFSVLRFSQGDRHQLGKEFIPMLPIRLFFVILTTKAHSPVHQESLKPY